MGLLAQQPQQPTDGEHRQGDDPVDLEQLVNKLSQVVPDAVQVGLDILAFCVHGWISSIDITTNAPLTCSAVKRTLSPAFTLSSSAGLFT